MQLPTAFFAYSVLLLAATHTQAHSDDGFGLYTRDDHDHLYERDAYAYADPDPYGLDEEHDYVHALRVRAALARRGSRVTCPGDHCNITNMNDECVECGYPCTG